MGEGAEDRSHLTSCEKNQNCFPSLRTNSAEFIPSFIQYNFTKVDLTALKRMAWRTEREQGMRGHVEQMREKESMGVSEQDMQIGS